MVSSFSNPGFPPVHTHPPTFSAMVATNEDSLRETLDALFAPYLAKIRRARELALGTEGDSIPTPMIAISDGGDSDPALMCSEVVESIEVGHPKPQNGDGIPLCITSTIHDHSSPSLISSSSLLGALATPTVKPQSNDSVAATVSLLGSTNVIHDSMTTASQLLPDCSESIFSNMCKFSGNEFAPPTLLRKIGAEFMRAQPSMIANKCQKELVGMSARYVFDEIPDSCCCAVLDRDMCYCKGIQDKGGGSKFRPLEDCRMSIGEKIAQSDHDDNIGYFTKMKLHVWCQLPSGLWELGMIRRHEIFQQPVRCYTLTDPCDNISYQRVVFNQRNTFNQRNYTIWLMEKPCILLSFKVVEENGKRTGFGFVQFDNEDSALAAASALNDTISKEKNLSVSIFVQKSRNDNRLQIFSNTLNTALSQEVATNITEACNNRVFGQIVLLLVQVVTTMIRLLEESANLKGLQDGHFRQEEELFVILSHKHRNDPLKIKEIISMVANSLTSLLNLEIEVKLLLQEDGTTTASILFFRVYGMHFKEQWKYGTKPYVTVPEQHCVSHHVFSYVIGKRWVLVELELHHKKTDIRIQMLIFGSEGGIVLRPNLRVDGASVYAWLYDYGRICKVCHKLKVILVYNMAHINVLVAAGVISFGCCWCYFFACSSGRMSTIFVFAYLSLHICLTVSVSWQKELFKFLALDTSQPPYVFKCQLYTLTRVMKGMVEALGLLRTFKSSMHNIGVANDSLKFSDFNDSERIAGFNIQYRLFPSISLFQKMEFYDNQTLGGPNVTGKSYERCFHKGKMYESYTFINMANGKNEFDYRHSRKNILELAPSSFYPHYAKFGRTEKDITPMGGFSHCGVVKDGYIQSNEGCVGPKKRIVNLRQSLLNKTARLALDDIKLITISKVIILGNGPIAIVAALVENLLAGSLGVGPFSPFDAAACFLATSMEIEMISWVEIYEEATSNKSSLTKLWGVAITSSGVLSGECPKVESYLQIVFAVPAASLLLQESLVSARSNKFSNFQP